MKRRLVVAVVALLAPLVGPVAPAQAGPDSWSHVWDRDQTVSTSPKDTLKFPRHLECPDNFHVRMSWMKWGYSSPEGATVRLEFIKLRLKPNHKLRVTIDGLNRRWPAGKYTTRKFAIDTSEDFGLLEWDGGDAVGVMIGDGQATSTWYAPNNYSVAGGCKQPFHLAGLKRHF